MDYPSSSGGWNGYLVVGCKFKQQLAPDKAADLKWAIAQLRSDLDKFLDAARNLRRPKYYLFATNVTLTAVQTKGGRDTINALLDNYATTLGFEGTAAWDYNDLRGFLDGDEDIRKAYGHFVTAGDVLAEMMKLLTTTRPSFEDVMSVFLQKELLADMTAKLQSAGEETEQRIPLASVFVDLPVVDSEAAALSTESRSSAEVELFTDTVLAAGAAVHRPSSQLLNLDDLSSARGKEARYVLVGGPGQGKSTLGQFLCQLYRAAILKDRSAERIDDRVRAAIRQLEQQRDNAGGLPQARRFPIRVELRALANALAAEPTTTLLECVRSQVEYLGGFSVTSEDMRSWLSTYPWLVVLDGLDEVPPSSNRDQVLRAIEHFGVDAASCNGDVLLLATTRPQSYSKELSPHLFHHLYLAPLTPFEALVYGQLLAKARCGGDERRREDLVRSLQKACEASTTARLMQSPLQVTIMATLLEETGEPPQQRYRLFAEYYRTIYRRETRRRLLDGILSERQTDIDTIHYQAGLLIQAGGEERAFEDGTIDYGDAEAALSDEQFRALVRRRLTSIGLDEPRLSEITSRITDGTLQRLVFLVRPKEGWIRFDVPSLKEFMAAEALMSGADEDIRDRLKVIAPASYWRNVLLFAIGKCFVDKEHLLDSTIALCEEFNDDIIAARLFAETAAGAAARSSRWGSRIALDVLSDGCARPRPDYQSRFARSALELVRTPDTDVIARLAAVYDVDLKTHYEEAIHDRLGQADFSQQRGAWQLLIELADRNVAWALETLRTRWPTAVERQTDLLRGRESGGTRWCAQKAREVVPFTSVWTAADLTHRYATYSGAVRTAESSWWRATRLFFSHPPATIRSGERVHIDFSSGLGQPSGALMIRLTSIASQSQALFDGFVELPADYHCSWSPLVAAARFLRGPTAEALSQELLYLAENWNPEVSAWWRTLPWPLAACVGASQSAEELRSLAQKAAVGRLGTRESWLAAEERWSQTGLTLDDYQTMTDSRLPFDPEIGRSGLPLAAVSVVATQKIPDGSLQQWVSDALSIFNSAASSMRAWLACAVLETITRAWSFRPPVPIQTPAIHNLFKASVSSPWRGGLQQMLLYQLLQPEVSLPDMEALSACAVFQVHFRPRYRVRSVDRILDTFCSDPHRFRGLLHVLANATAGRRPCVVPREILSRCIQWGDEFRLTSWFLSLANQDASATEIEQFASGALDASTASVVARMLEIAAEGFLPRSRGVALALQLRELLTQRGQNDLDAERTLFAVISDNLTRRPSGLSSGETWRRLHLPDKELLSSRSAQRRRDAQNPAT